MASWVLQRGFLAHHSLLHLIFSFACPLRRTLTRRCLATLSAANHCQIPSVRRFTAVHPRLRSICGGIEFLFFFSSSSSSCSCSQGRIFAQLWSNRPEGLESKMVVGYASEFAAVQLLGRRTAAGTIGIAFGLGPYDYNYSVQHVQPLVRCTLTVLTHL